MLIEEDDEMISSHHHQADGGNVDFIHSPHININPAAAEVWSLYTQSHPQSSTPPNTARVVLLEY